MPDTPEEGRLYDEEDVARILKAASERQSKRKTPQSGLTLEEIKEVAAEAGIDPRHVTDAVAELSRSPAVVLPAAQPASSAPDKPNFWGGPLSVTRETVIDGEIDDFAWEEMVSEARREFNDTGEVRKWSNSREWASNVNNARSHVTLTARSGKSRLQVFWSNPAYAAAAWVPALIVSLISLPIVFEELALTGGLAAFIILSVLIMAFSAARLATSQIARGHQRKMERLLARLEQIARLRAVPGLEASAVAKTSGVKDAAGLPRADQTELDEIDEWGEAGQTSERRQRNRTR
ncbi:MAG: hypothetical protein R3282_00770 [Rhodothermales bacterium]|nr:hypothetical protein [Rhodothermales bacterium]